MTEPDAQTTGHPRVDAALAELDRIAELAPAEQAAALVADGRVEVRGLVAGKPAAMVDPADPVRLVGDAPPEYASRGGHKLAGALAAFGASAAFGGLSVAGRRCLDAGASTGGFTDVLLRAGAREVVAVDVGYGQLAWSLQSDERVQVHDRTNVREVTAELIGGPVDVVVGDLSFISLALVLEPLVGVTNDDGDLALMVKPQFEVGKDRVGKGGVVRDPTLRAEAVVAVAARAASLGWGARAVARSPLPGPSGNVEFFVWLRHGPAGIDDGEIHNAVYG